MKIVITEPLGITTDALQALCMLLKADGHEILTFKDRVQGDDLLIQRIGDADVIILANQPLSREVIEACPNLKLIDIAFTGVDHVDVNCCKERNIMICNAAGYSTNAVAELSFGLMIQILRQINECDRKMRLGTAVAGTVGTELYGKKLGIIGTGRIGQKVASIAHAFGCEILAYSRTQKQNLIELGVKYVSLEQLLKEADIITLHLPASKDTEHLLGETEFKMMKKNSILINTARGNIVDTQALVKALQENEIGGVGLDVFEQEEPLNQGNPLLKAPNTVLTPHIAYATKESLYQRALIVFDNVRCWLEGNPQNVVK